MSTEPLSSQPPAADLQSIGWWIESADDEIYGPASRATLVRFLSEGVISPNTLVRHSTEFNKRPAMDVPGVREALPANASYLPHGDRLGEAWPRRKRDQLALAQDSIPCVWKNRPAVLVCRRPERWIPESDRLHRVRDTTQARRWPRRAVARGDSDTDARRCARRERAAIRGDEFFPRWRPARHQAGEPVGRRRRRSELDYRAARAHRGKRREMIDGTSARRLR